MAGVHTVGGPGGGGCGVPATAASTAQPGLRGPDVPQRFAAGLLMSVITMISVPPAVQADRYPGPAVVPTIAPQEPAPLIVQPSAELTPQAAAAPRAERVDDDGHHHHV